LVVAATILVVLSCGDNGLSTLGDAAVDAGEMLRDAAARADASSRDAEPELDASRPPSVVLTGTCELSSNGTSRVAQWDVPGLRASNARIVRSRFCEPEGDFGPPEARAQDCEVSGFGFFVSDDRLVAPCFFYTTAEVEIEF